MMAEAEKIAYASSVLMMAEELERVFGRWY